MMNKCQQGKTGIVFIIILALIGVGVYIGLQYIPQRMEAGMVGSILENLEQNYAEQTPKSVDEVNKSIEKFLNINEMEALKDSFSVTKTDEGEFIVTVSYSRELNLIFQKKTIPFEKEIIL